MRAGRRRRQAGFTYVGVLLLVALLGLGLVGTSESWTIASRRARERELLWVGNQYARAIKAYYLQSPGVRQFPVRLEDLLEDRRFPEPRHHLRQLYLDPISREPFQAVLSPDGRIGGVRSGSDDTPMKQDNFPVKFRDFKGSVHYSDWLFVPDNLPGGPLRPQAASTDAPAGSTTPATAATPAATSAAPVTATPAAPIVQPAVTISVTQPGAAAPAPAQ